MYNRNDKRHIYWLIDEYLNKNIDVRHFCDEFYFSYALEIEPESLNEIEKNTFIELNKIISRFSPFEEDFELDRNAFTTIEELNRAIKLATDKL